MNTTRRTFLRLTGAAAGALVIAKYAEPLAVLADHGPWVEDKGDFYIVRVPDFKTFANEHLEKPTIFLLGESATVRSVDVDGFANIFAPKGGIFTQSRIDSSRMAAERARPALTLKGARFAVTDCHLLSNEGDGIVFERAQGEHKVPAGMRLIDFGRGKVWGVS
jgi:hypothetical protein